MFQKTRKAPGSSGKGKYFHIEVIPKESFSSFYTEDVGRRGHSMLVLGKRKEDGKWSTHKWLISKEDAYISEDGSLRSDDPRILQILAYVDGNLTHKVQDIFYVRPHRSLRESDEKQKRCSRESCPEMYFDDYEEYERYTEERLSKTPSESQNTSA